MYNCFYEEKPLGQIIMHVLVDQEHDGPPRTKSHDLRHYALVERQEPATVNHGDLSSQVNRHSPFLPVHPCDHPSSSPVNLFPLRLGALSTNTIFTLRRNRLHISQKHRPHSVKKPYVGCDSETSSLSTWIRDLATSKGMLTQQPRVPAVKPIPTWNPHLQVLHLTSE